jgi:hypothetical protein
MDSKEMQYSFQWYQDVLARIPGVEKVVVGGKPGDVSLMLHIAERADSGQIREEIIRRMRAEHGLIFKCRVTLLKTVSQFGLNDLDANP